MDGGHDDGDARRDGLPVAREREPRLTGQPHVTRVEFIADPIDREGALTHEATVDAGQERSCPSAV